MTARSNAERLAWEHIAYQLLHSSTSDPYWGAKRRGVHNACPTERPRVMAVETILAACQIGKVVYLFLFCSFVVRTVSNIYIRFKLPGKVMSQR